MKSPPKVLFLVSSWQTRVAHALMRAAFTLV